MARVFQRDGSYWIDFKDAQGIRHRKKVGPTKRVAKEVLDGILGNVARRVHLGVIVDSPISFSDFADTWWERVKHTLRPRTRERWWGSEDEEKSKCRGIVLMHLKLAFSGALRSITAAQVQAYVAKRMKAGAQPSTINRELTVLKHIMRRAVAWEYLSRNPFLDSNGTLVEGLRALKEPQGRSRFLSPDEIECLLAACAESESPFLRPFVIVALNTGMRRNEILSLTRRSVDWQNRIATLEQTKNGETRRVYLNNAAFEALKGLPARLDGKLVPLDPNQVSMLFGRAVKRAKIEDFRLHDCRHTFASYQAMSGVQSRGLQDLLGHKDSRMTMRYSHLSDAYLRAAVDRVSLGADMPATNPTSSKDGTHLAPTGTDAKREGFN